MVDVKFKGKLSVLYCYLLNLTSPSLGFINTPSWCSITQGRNCSQHNKPGGGGYQQTNFERKVQQYCCYYYVIVNIVQLRTNDFRDYHCTPPQNLCIIEIKEFHWGLQNITSFMVL